MSEQEAVTDGTHGIADPPDPSWRVECRVTLTEADVDRLTDLVTTRYARAGGRARSWRLVCWQAGLGFLVALVAVLLRAAEAEKAGIIAAAAFLACWAAMAIYGRAVERSRRDYRSQTWRSDGYAYTVAIRAGGVHMAWRDSVTEMGWRGFSAAEGWGTFVVLWRGADSPVAIPVQALPPECPAVELVHRCAACIAAARPT